MDENDKRGFANSMKGFLYAAHGTHSPDTEVIKCYWAVLEKYSLGDVTKALNMILQSVDGHITPRDIERAITGEQKPEPAKAWRFYMECLKAKGVRETRSTDCDDERAQRAFVAIGGAAAMNYSPDKLIDVKSRFFEEYNSANPSKDKATQ